MSQIPWTSLLLSTTMECFLTLLHGWMVLKEYPNGNLRFLSQRFSLLCHYTVASHQADNLTMWFP